jgi:hypothetical protein
LKKVENNLFEKTEIFRNKNYDFLELTKNSKFEKYTNYYKSNSLVTNKNFIESI